VKGFFAAFSWVRIWKFRTRLQHLFLWRLKLQKPEVVILGVDTMVMESSEAKKRHGVQWTYKRGFKHLTRGPYIIDAVFRGGTKNYNHGDTAIKMFERVVGRIRTSHREDVPISALRRLHGLATRRRYAFTFITTNVMSSSGTCPLHHAFAVSIRCAITSSDDRPAASANNPGMRS